jgi:hypothetical protein
MPMGGLNGTPELPGVGLPGRGTGRPIRYCKHMCGKVLQQAEPWVRSYLLRMLPPRGRPRRVVSCSLCFSSVTDVLTHLVLDSMPLAGERS